MNERLLILRKELDLTQEKFGERLGVRKTAISKLEKGENRLTEQMIMSICREFNVREEWLKEGIEPKFNDSDEFSLDDYAKQNKLTALEFDILKTYMELDSDVRKNLMSNLKAIFNKHDKAEITNITSSNDPTLEELEEEYKKRHSKSVSKTEVSASNGIGGDKNKVV